MSACPNCRHPCEPGAKECAACGAVFEKWAAKGHHAAAAPAPLGARPAFLPLSRLAVIGLLLAAGWWGWRRAQFPREKGTSPQSSTPAKSPDAHSPELAGSAETAYVPSGYDPVHGISRLEGMLGELRRVAGSYGEGLTLDHIKHEFLKGAEVIHPAVLLSEAIEAGLPLPERQPIGKEEPAGRFKCRQDKSLDYGESPSSDEGIEECWERLSYRAGTVSVSYPLGGGLGMQHTQSGGYTTFWEKRVWQPNTRRWASHTEEDEMRVLEHLMRADYGFEKETLEQARMREDLEKALARTDLAEEWKAQQVHLIAVQGYAARLRREGLQYRLDWMGAQREK